MSNYKIVFTKSSMIKQLNLTIVIPTLGEDTINKCIQSVYNNNYQPKEIIIIIPRTHAYKISLLVRKYKNITIYKTDFMGQVAQRAYGFKKTNTEFVMQLDSDIILSEQTIERLYKFLLNRKKIAVSPILLPNNIKQYQNINPLTKLLRNYLIFGQFKSKIGVITSIGYNSWFENKDFKNNFYNVEWLPGGCIIFRKKDLIKKSFYPYKGKAYCEDILHSILLREKKINLYLLTNVRVKNIGYTHNKLSLFEKLKEFKIRFYILRKLKGSYFRFFLWFLIYAIK